MLAMLWTNYRFRKHDYASLLNVLKQPNKYRFALLLKECTLKGSVGRFKVIKLPEGILILARNPRIRGIGKLIDLSKQSLKLVCYTLYIPAKSERIRLQVNRHYLRLLLKRIKALSGAYWYGSKRKFLKDYLKAVNQIIREANDLASTCFVYPETIQAFNKKLKQIIFKHLTSVQGLKSKEAKKVIAKYLTTLRH